MGVVDYYIVIHFTILPPSHSGLKVMSEKLWFMPHLPQLWFRFTCLLSLAANSQLLGSYPGLPQGPLYIGIRAGGHLLEVSHLKYNGSLCISAGENGFKRWTLEVYVDFAGRTSNCRVRWSALITYQNWQFPDLAVMCMTRSHQAASIIALNTSVH